MYKDHETPRFWVSYAEPLQKYISKRVRDKMMGEDVLHDVYIKIYCHCKRFDFCCQKAGVKNLRSWIFQVCHNTMVDYYKSGSKYFYTNSFADQTAIVLPDLQIEKKVSLESLLKGLPEKYSTPLAYDVLLSMKQADIAQTMGLSLTATKSRIQRARQMLIDQKAAIQKF